MTTSTRKVLIADDEPDVHKFVKAALEDDGYEFLSAAHGAEAVQLAGSERPDLIILDVQMPKKSGFTAFSELRRADATKGIPIIMLTAVSQRVGLSYSGQDMGQFYGADPDAFIDKPVDPQTLRDTARRLVS